MKPIISLMMLFAVALSINAESLHMPVVFADHMVLQRDQAVPVWGRSEPNVMVEVRFSGQKKSTVADADGKWIVRLDALKASADPQVLHVSSDGTQLSFSDVLVGEVWLCGGQSNMEFTMTMLTKKARESQYEPNAEYIRNEIALANDPLFRQFKVKRQLSAYEEKTHAAGTWSKAVPGQVEEFSGTGYFFGRELRRELGVPVALLSCNWGGTLVEAWIPQFAYEKDTALKAYFDDQHNTLKQNVSKWDEIEAKAAYEEQLAAWEQKASQAKKEGKKAPQKPRMKKDPVLSNRIPSTLYNGMTHSLVPYGIKGAIWYQGETNRGHRSDAYGQHFSALIDAWRERWGQEKFYFYWCQLAKYTDPPEEPVVDDGWVNVCYGQFLTMNKPDAGMAVLNDIGEAKDIHPRNKVDVGKRLSLWALKQAYGRNLVCSGPIYRESEIEGNKMVLRFDHIGSGLMVGNKHLMEPVRIVNEPLSRFQICGADGVWKWAQARITAKDEVTVWHDDITDPVEVRYAWSANAEGANLYNKEGLPASLFKTER